jgi:hypothetical protein
MPEIQIAFYKGGAGWIHKTIRWWTKSPHSHAELILPDGKTWVSISPFLTSRVAPRIKYQVDVPEDWDFLTFELNWRQPVQEYQLDQLYKFIDMTQGSKYDWVGMIMSHFCPYLIKRRDRWYCSEWIAHALVNSRIIMWDDLKLYDTPDLSPGKLYTLLKDYIVKQRSQENDER